MKLLLRWLWLPALVLIAAQGCDDGGGGGGRMLQSRLYASGLKDALETTARRYQSPGAVLLVEFQDGSVWEGATGVAGLGESGGGWLTTDHAWRVGSITKTFTGTATLLLVDDGLLGLEDTLDQWLPGLVPGGDRITVRMLLNHTSGLSDYTHDDDFQDIYADTPTTFWTPAELVAIANRQGPWFEPGDGAAYSNTNYILLGMLIEAAAHQEVEPFMISRIFDPLEMDHTRLPETADMTPPFASGYLDLNQDGRFDAGEDVTRQDPSALWTAGAVVSTPRDLLIWVRELAGGTLLSPELQAERTAFHIPIEGAEGGYFGLGISQLGESVGHTGAVIGYTSVAFTYKGVDIVAYSNGYLLGADTVNIANEIYAAAVKAIFGDEIAI